MTTVDTRVPVADVRSVFDMSGAATERECRDCPVLLPSSHFSTHAGGCRRFVCRPCFASRLAMRGAAS